MDIFLLAIIGANILISYKGFNDLSFFRKNEFHIGSIRAGEQFRMVSSGFLHGDWAHLFFNMFSLYMFGPEVIDSFGPLSFILIYFVSLVAGSLLTLSFHNNDINYRAVGASGAVTGIVYSAILLHPDMSLYLYFIPIPIPGYIFGIGYLLYSIYGMKAQNDNIGHVAHFGGAIGGYTTTLIKEPNMFVDNTFMVVVLAIPIVLLYILAKSDKL
ncbi:rhomboid family intramembrane serine protease [Flavobacterium amnicola]|uniref:Rhomboid family intramembrane serine protease n=1 Tax=Flavobacterium amnicola TaxID=2506422 RepID=A0A4Q1K372_9FLAO|nr:rhomboid family intramembrane serine protease [Flavobacterium amnicola]RXR16339.1 rhomboid family intramembrane serine protease [Flavobacterium amnicola]